MSGGFMPIAPPELVSSLCHQRIWPYYQRPRAHLAPTTTRQGLLRSDAYKFCDSCYGSQDIVKTILSIIRNFITQPRPLPQASAHHQHGQSGMLQYVLRHAAK